MERLPELLNHVRRCHSPAQMHFFIVVKGGAFCDYGALRQALREVDSRVKIVRDKALAFGELEDKLFTGAPALSEPDWKHRRLLAKQEDLNRSLHERADELAHFYALACALKDRVEADHGPLTRELHDSLDFGMWVHRLKMQAAGDLESTGRVSSSTMETIRALPRGPRGHLLHLIERGDLPGWARSIDYTLPLLEARAIMSAEEIVAYVADPDCPRLGPGFADDAQARRVLEGRAGARNGR